MVAAAEVRTNAAPQPFRIAGRPYVGTDGAYRLQMTLKSQYRQVSASAHWRNGVAGS